MTASIQERLSGIVTIYFVMWKGKATKSFFCKARKCKITVGRRSSLVPIDGFIQLISVKLISADNYG